MLKIGEFVSQVTSEISKVTWSNKKETAVSVMLVVVMVFISAIFFLGVDVVAYKLMNAILNLGVN
jgi:preprotein translocase SecE subunit